jgi:diguanylate cyclase (GGDEF)-like protein
MSTSSKIVVVVRDQELALRLSARFNQNGWTTRFAYSVEEGRRLFTRDWDLAVVAHNQAVDGFALCSELRGAGHGYIVMLTDNIDDALEAFDNGADDCVSTVSMDELVARVRAGLRVVTLQKALAASNRELQRLSRIDSLTSLHNRRAFDEEITTRFEQARRYERPLSVAVIDVDHFKSINDTHGHQAGDAVLRALGQLLQSASRSSDFVARYGGEEFAVILPETDLADAKRFAEKIRVAVERATIYTGSKVHDVTVSIGVASMPHSYVPTAGALVHAADLALYRAKAAGRNRAAHERRREPVRPAEILELVAG